MDGVNANLSMDDVAVTVGCNLVLGGLLSPRGAFFPLYFFVSSAFTLSSFLRRIPAKNHINSRSHSDLFTVTNPTSDINQDVHAINIDELSTGLVLSLIMKYCRIVFNSLPTFLSLHRKDRGW